LKQKIRTGIKEIKRIKNKLFKK